jgi:glycosyltransferase involved in cell wall biosynthesis
MKLSVLMPVYNEEATVGEIVQRVLAEGHEKELIIVDDGSCDDTPAVLRRLARDHAGAIKLITHQHNQGKGAAVRSALAEVTGEVVIIQDADLEYDPQDYRMLLGPIEEGLADAVYGSRFLGVHRVLLFWHYLGNRLLTLVTNLLYNVNLTDMETCYKAIRAECLRGVPLRSNKFDIEPEITAKLLKRGARLYEVPIKYAGRTYAEGKKVGWADGLQALWTLLKYRFTD